MRAKAGNTWTGAVETFELPSDWSLDEADGHVKASSGGSITALDAETRAVNLSPIPGFADNTYQNNSDPWSQDNLWTHNGYQYAVWFDDSRKPHIGKRLLPHGSWTTFDLSTVTGNPLGSPAISDGHGSISLGIGSDGIIHVSGNMHGNALRYVVSDNPEDITAWSAGAMVGSNEDLVTYPQFVKHPDGTLLFHYRDGASGNGDNYLNAWSGGAWTRVAQLVDGTSNSESAYNNRLVIDADGVFHYSFAWKPDGGDYNSINDIGYMKSADKGSTWKAIDGTTVTVPITHATAPTILDTAATGSGIANQFGMDVDHNGRPHMATFYYDGTNRQINHLYWDGAAWQNIKVTNFTVTANDFTHWPARPFIFCTRGSIPADERIYIGLHYRYEGLRGKLWLLDVTDGADYTTVERFPILEFDLREWESTFDTQALIDRNELHLLVTPVNSDAGSPRPGYYNADNWNAQWLGVLTVDLDQIVFLQKRAVQLPGIKTFETVSVPEGQTATASSLTTIANAHSTVTPSELEGRIVLVRLRSRMSVSGGTTPTGTVAVSETQQGGSSRTFGSIATANTSTQLQTGPWMPLKFGPRSNADSLLRIFGGCSGGGTLTLSAATLEVGVLDGPLYPPA